MDWVNFFPPQARVCALPSWKAPYLYIPADTRKLRWECAELFPGWRPSGRLRRTLLRIKAAYMPGQIRTANTERWRLGEFVAGIFDSAHTVALLSNPRNFSGKLVAQIRNKNGAIIGYVKYGGREAARKRLQNEYAVLNALPPDMGPTPLKFGNFLDGTALCLSPLAGTELMPETYLSPKIVAFINKLPASDPHPLDSHPWACRIREQAGNELEKWFEKLENRKWPIVLQHGDFAPWNLIVAPDGSLRALDWEYANTEGFPYIDFAYYLLQTDLLVHRKSPSAAIENAIEFITSCIEIEPLDTFSARAIIALAAYEQYTKSLEDGHSPATRVQKCRLSIWKDAV